MKNILILLSMSFMLASCSRSVQVASTETYSESKKEQVKAVSEITKATTTEISEKETVQGDSLAGSLTFAEPTALNTPSATEEMESGGILVTANLEKTEAGYKVNIKTIAKPKTGIERTIRQSDTNTDVNQLNIARSDSSQSKKSEDKKKVVSPHSIHAFTGGLYCSLLSLDTSSGESISNT